MSENFSFFLPLSKVKKESDGSVTVSGYASTPALDLDGEVITLDAVKAALPGYWQWRNIREMHKPSAVGVAKEASIDHKGLFLTSRITDPVAAQKCLDGVYKGYSIGGRKLSKVGNTVTEIEMVEISVVDRPANPECKLEIQKGAKSGPAFLVPTTKRSPQQQALIKSAGAIKSLAKAINEPNPEPAPATAESVCEKHGIADCEKCAGKAAKSAEKAAAKLAKKAAKVAAKKVGKAAAKAPPATPEETPPAVLGKTLDLKFGSPKVKSTLLSFQNFDVDNREVRPVEDLGKCSHELAPGLGGEPRKDSDFLKFPKAAKPSASTPTDNSVISTLFGKDFSMTTENALGKFLVGELLKARAPTRASMMKSASDNLDKANAMRKSVRKSLKAAFNMHKSAYLAKQALVKAGKAKPDGDADDFDHQGAMEKLQKAASDLESMKTFHKAAGENLAKVARSGQRGQQPTDGNEFFEVPAGVKELDPVHMATLSPGGGGSGSMPPEMMLDGPALKAAGFVSTDHAEALARAAAAEAQVEILGKMPGPGRRPVAFLNKAGGGGADKDESLTKMFQGVNMADFQSGDENLHKAASARALGNMLLGGVGAKTIFDPNFHGTAGGTGVS